MIKYFLISLLSTSAFSQTYLAGKTPDQIVELKKNATLKMEIQNEKGHTINTFVGYFVGKGGRFATVYHSIQDDLKFDKSKNKLIVHDGSGKEISGIMIEGCGNKNNTDICTGMVKNYSPKYYFEFSTSERREGELFASIGHCKNDQLAYFTSKQGEVKKVTTNYQSAYNAIGDTVNVNTKLFEVSLPKCVGDSGGPVFDQFTGALMGMYSFSYKNHFFAIDATEVKKALDENQGKVLYDLPAEKASAPVDPCEKIKKGTREYANCKDLE